MQVFRLVYNNLTAVDLNAKAGITLYDSEEHGLNVELFLSLYQTSAQRLLVRFQPSPLKTKIVATLAPILSHDPDSRR